MDLLFRDIPAIDGVLESTAYPALKYFSTPLDWHLGVLTPQEVEGLREQCAPPGALPARGRGALRRGRADPRAVVTDGRATHAEIAADHRDQRSSARRGLAPLLRRRPAHPGRIGPAYLGLRPKPALARMAGTR